MDPLPQAVYVTMTGSIGPELVAKAFNAFSAVVNRGSQTVHLLIQSTGGVIGDGIGLYNYLRKLPLELICYNGGTVASVAVPVFLAGSKRKASKTAMFMIHKAYGTAVPNVAVRADHMRNLAQALDADDRRLEAIIFDVVKLPAEKADIHKHLDLLITPEEALAFGLIDEIADFAPPAGAQVFNI